MSKLIQEDTLQTRWKKLHIIIEEEKQNVKEEERAKEMRKYKSGIHYFEEKKNKLISLL